MWYNNPVVSVQQVGWRWPPHRATSAAPVCFGRCVSAAATQWSSCYGPSRTRVTCAGCGTRTLIQPLSVSCVRPGEGETRRRAALIWHLLHRPAGGAEESRTRWAQKLSFSSWEQLGGEIRRDARLFQNHQFSSMCTSGYSTSVFVYAVTPRRNRLQTTGYCRLKVICCQHTCCVLFFGLFYIPVWWQHLLSFTCWTIEEENGRKWTVFTLQLLITPIWPDSDYGEDQLLITGTVLINIMLT